MSPEEKDLDDAYSRYGKRLKSKLAKQEPTKDEKIRTRLEQVDREAPLDSRLFAQSDARLEQLKEEFQIAIQKPQTLQEYIVYLLAQEHVGGTAGSNIALVDLYSAIHHVDQYRKLSRKEFEKSLKRLEKEATVQLTEIRGTLVVKLRDRFLSEDEATILDIAARKDGKTSLEQIMLSTRWTQARVQTALDSLITKKMIVQKKSYTRGTRYQVSESP
jgi:hypothetical protein